MTFPRAVLVLSAVLLLSCSGSDQNRGDDPKQTTPSKTTTMNISPGRCRIVGSVVAISAERNADPLSPCSKQPCRATVRIDSVLGYGSGFGGRFVQGKEVDMEFAFTLGPTTESLFPNMDTRYPGLTTGSVFKADVMPTQSEGISDSPSAYRVSAYTKIR